ncbi:MAG: hypothetical protein AB1485_08395 [Candidatus Thermoplasmatota archaeon]
MVTVVSLDITTLAILIVGMILAFAVGAYILSRAVARKPQLYLDCLIRESERENISLEEAEKKFGDYCKRFVERIKGS